MTDAPEQPPAATPRPLRARLLELVRHSLIYGVGGLVQRFLAVITLPIYTRYLTAAAYGRIGVLMAAAAVMTVLLRMGLQTAFFRWYYDSDEPEYRRRLIRTSFWFTMVTASLALVVCLVVAGPISSALGGSTPVGTSLVRATAVLLWVNINYAQITALFRVEGRSLAYTIATLSNIAITVPLTIVLVAVVHEGAVGVIVGNLSGTLVVYVALLAYRREQLGLQFDRRLWWAMNLFGMPLVPAALATWVTNFGDRFMLAKLVHPAARNFMELGQYTLAVNIGSIMVLLVTAFQLAWPPFAYGIKDEDEAKRAYSYVLTYLMLFASWAALALGLFAPWIVHILAPTRHGYWAASGAVAPIAYSSVCFGGFIVATIAVGRTRQTQFNWIAATVAAVVNFGLNLWVIPAYGMIGAAWATLAGYVALFAVRMWNAQKLYPVAYQWKRIALLLAAAGGLSVAGALLPRSLVLAFALTLAYPIVLWTLRFFLPTERKQLKRLLPAHH